MVKCATYTVETGIFELGTPFTEETDGGGEHLIHPSWGANGHRKPADLLAGKSKARPETHRFSN